MARDKDRPNWGDSKHFQMFSQHRLDLAQEVKNHPKLMEFLANHDQDEFEIMIAEIAAYCEVGLDGDYTPIDLDNLCKILYQKLINKRLGLTIVSAEENKEDS